MDLRADARRNRDQLLAAASELFAERGFGVPLDEVAQRAGVGVGTLYRRFPDRRALIYAVSSSTLDRLGDLARTARAEEPDAWSALTRYLRGCAEVKAGALLTSLNPALHDEIRRHPEVGRARGELIGVLEEIVTAAQSAGDLRDDVGAGDIVLLGMLLSRRETELPEAIADALPDRFMGLAIDGLRAANSAVPSEPLPGDPITALSIDRGRPRGG